MNSMLDGKNQGTICIRAWFRALLFGFFALTMMGVAPATNRQPTKDQTQDKTKSPSEVTDPDLDTTHWSMLRNKYGWKINFPKTWVHDDHAETSGQITFYSPSDCVKERCATFQIDSEINRGRFKDSLERYLSIDKPRPGLLSHRKFEIGGLPALDVVGLTKPRPERTDLVREIAVKHNGRILKITYSEGGKDRDTTKSPADWKYVAIFDKILGTLSFYDVPESVWPKPQGGH
jgi:hypothetical protein